MMQKFLTKYWLASQMVLLFVAVSMSLFSTETTGKNYLFWLALFAVESLLLLPTVFKEESITEARKRVVRSLEGDPFTYVGLVLIGIISIQWMNSGCSLIYLPDADVWKFSLPPAEWLPYSVKPLPARALLSLVIAVFAGGLVIRNGLGKGGKRYFLDVATMVSGMMATVAVYQSHAGVAPYTTWAAHPGACNPGTFFAFWFLIALGRGSNTSSSKASPLKNALGWGFAFIGNLAGFLQFAPGFGLIVYSVIGLLLIGYRIGMMRLQGVQVAKQLRFAMGTFCAIALLGCSVIFLIPQSPIIPKVKGVSDVSSFEKMMEARRFRMNAAFKIWEEDPWTGVGANGFSQYLGTVIEDREWKRMKADKQWVWNDGLQFLCEWGVIGTGILVAMVVTMLIPLFIKVRTLFRSQSKGRSAWEEFLYVDDYMVPCMVVVILVLIEGWFSSPFQSPAVLMSWFCVLAVLPGLLPAQRVKHS